MKINALKEYGMKETNILVIDDDIDLSEEVAEILNEQGYRVGFARTLQQFEQRTADHPFDLYIVDLLLPDGHGHEIIRRVRAVGAAGIVVLSGKLSEVDKVVSLELGADDYVVKPFARSEFAARINSLLRRLATRNVQEMVQDDEATLVEYAGWRINTKTRKVYQPSGDEIHLTKLEFDLWLTFAQSFDRVLSREEIITCIRGRDWAGYDRSIDGLVSRMLKKLSVDPMIEENFETVRGVGYMLRSPT